jgi:6-phosphogluconate dehydrogenase
MGKARLKSKTSLASCGKRWIGRKLVSLGGCLMQLGMVGLGRMGLNMSLRLSAKGHNVIGFDPFEEARRHAEDSGLKVVASLDALVEALDTPRSVWLMVPAKAVDDLVVELRGKLSSGDVVIDGGNGHYMDDQRHSRELAEAGISLLDCGTSGGVFGRERGYCLMIGGSDEAFSRLRPIFRDLAPGVAAAPRTRESGEVSDAEEGFYHVGPSGAGHFVKMVHNGIEYGMMASIAEGLAILAAADAGDKPEQISAEEAPLRDPEGYKYKIAVDQVAELWRRGSVVSSWLLDLTAHALGGDPKLDSFAGRVSDSGEGRWTVEAAIDEGVPAPTIAAALFSRFASQGHGTFADKVLSAMRKEFGGHDELKGGS